MSVHQLNIFVENRKGTLSGITELLSANDIDLKTLVLADATDYGVLRLIVSDTDQAISILKENGVIASAIKITIARIQHVQGGLSAVLKMLEMNDVNIEYMYAFVAQSGREAYAAMRFDDADKDKALQILKDGGIALVEDAALL